MMSSIYLGQTAFLVFLDLLMLILAYLVMKPAIVSPYVVNGSRRTLGIIICFLFCLFSFWGADWYGYIAEIAVIKEFGASNSNMERFYIWLIENVSDNYLVFRTIVWGSALFLFLLTLRRLQIRFDLALLLFSTVWIIWFSYARVSLSMSILFFGSSLLYKPSCRHKLLSYALGIAAIVCAFFLHKSSVFGISVVVLAILSQNKPKNISTVLLIAFPVFVLLAGYFINNLSLLDIGDESDLSFYLEAGAKHLRKRGGGGGIGTFIQKLLERIPYYILAFYALKSMRSSSYYEMPKEIQLFVRILIYVVLFASVFAFNFGPNTRVLYSRFLRFAAIPAVIVLSYMLEHGMFNGWPRRIYHFALAGSFYSVLYMMYNAFVG